MRFMFCCILLGMLSGCTDLQEEVVVECQEMMLEKHSMILYTGQDIGCKSFLVLYRHDGISYYKYCNNCADISLAFEDCSENRICDTTASAELCNSIYKSENRVRIVGIVE